MRYILPSGCRSVPSKQRRNCCRPAWSDKRTIPLRSGCSGKRLPAFLPAQQVLPRQAPPAARPSGCRPGRWHRPLRHHPFSFLPVSSARPLFLPGRAFLPAWRLLPPPSPHWALRPLRSCPAAVLLPSRVCSTLAPQTRRGQDRSSPTRQVPMPAGMPKISLLYFA